MVALGVGLGLVRVRDGSFRVRVRVRDGSFRVRVRDERCSCTWVALGLRLGIEGARAPG